MSLTAKQIRFCNEYMIDFNATQAAIRSGYSKKTARTIGAENLTKLDIRTYIDDKLKELALTANETLKALSDIARASLNDYFVIRQVVTTPQKRVSLQEIINGIKDEIEDAQKFIDRLANVTTEALEDHQASQQRREREILKLEIELERNPNATRIINGEPYLTEHAELDMPRLVKDKAAGRIKTIKHTEHGINVELYPADAALRDLARVHGLFEKDNEQLKPKTNITVGYGSKHLED